MGDDFLIDTCYDWRIQNVHFAVGGQKRQIKVN